MTVLSNRRGKDGYVRVVDNRMRWHGDTDVKKKIIRVNKSAKKNKERGEKIDTIVHEERHAAHPKEHEKTVRRKTKEIVKRLSQKQKQKYYGRYNKRSYHLK